MPFNYYSGSASVLYRFTRGLSVESGVRAAWVRVEGPDPYPLLWSLFVAGSLRHDGDLFVKRLLGAGQRIGHD